MKKISIILITMFIIGCGNGNNSTKSNIQTTSNNTEINSSPLLEINITEINATEDTPPQIITTNPLYSPPIIQE